MRETIVSFVRRCLHLNELRSRASETKISSESVRFDDLSTREKSTERGTSIYGCESMQFEDLS